MQPVLSDLPDADALSEPQGHIIRETWYDKALQRISLSKTKCG